MEDKKTKTITKYTRVDTEFIIVKKVRSSSKTSRQSSKRGKDKWRNV